MRTLVAVALGLLAPAVMSGCYPKGQLYEVGNEGGIVFQVNPPDAEVLIDGVSQGKASAYNEDRYLKVEAGTHRLMLRAPGHEPYVRDVYVSRSLKRIEATLVELPAPGPRDGRGSGN